MTALYTFGSDKSLSSGCHLEKFLQQRRPTITPVFNNGKPLSYGPASAEKTAEPASSGEDSEVNITDIPINKTELLQ